MDPNNSQPTGVTPPVQTVGIDSSIPQQPLPISPIVQPAEVPPMQEVQQVAPPPVLPSEPEKKKMSVMNIVLIIMALVLIVALGYIAFVKLTTKSIPEPTPIPVVQIDPTEEAPEVPSASPSATP